MKNIIQHFNKLFESRIRLGIMSVLMVNEEIDYNTLKNYLQVTDGNLASHLTSLEKANYITVSKSFNGKKPLTTYKISNNGKLAFNNHLEALEQIIKQQKKTEILTLNQNT